MNLGLPEIMVIAVIALLVLGPERLPDAARKVGKLIGDVKRLQDAVKTEFDSAMVDLQRNRPPSYDDPQTPAEDRFDDHAPPPSSAADPVSDESTLSDAGPSAAEPSAPETRLPSEIASAEMPAPPTPPAAFGPSDPEASVAPGASADLQPPAVPSDDPATNHDHDS